MTQYHFASVASHAAPQNLAELKHQYLNSLDAPLDGMWESFVGGGKHWMIVETAGRSEPIGYCVLNDEQKVLQFFTQDLRDGPPAFEQMCAQLAPSGAFVATQQAAYLSYCLDHKRSLTVNTLLYREDVHPVGLSGLELRVVTEGEFEAAVEFGIAVLGCDLGWLQGYYKDHIAKQQLFGVWKDGSLIATGECRISETQKPYADVGMMVTEKHRGQGLATDILRSLRHMCKARGLQAICSTEVENVAAQKAITNAGFVSEHRILEIGF
ncbi:MAG: GNAT family N-acetyltransferase [Robiginitomaculum sp.]|nr:MAG: GNAT family N-acetyltransferase [Robiginitomaculum sp.]